MNRVFIDTEFLNLGAGQPIHLISIGLVREGGGEFYGINVDAPLGMMAANRWIRRNLWSTLPLEPIQDDGILDWDKDHPDIQHVFELAKLREEVYQFLVAEGPVDELWGWHSGFDYVVLSQLFGTFDDRREGIPMFVHDIAQVVHTYRGTGFVNMAAAPAREGVLHNALDDARYVEALHDWIFA